MTTARDAFGLATLMCQKCGRGFSTGNARAHKRCGGGSRKSKDRQCAICRENFYVVEKRQRLRGGALREVSEKVFWSSRKIAAHKMDHIRNNDSSEDFG